MAGRIPQQFIDELINTADIVDVIDSRVALKKRGKEHVACCPFHTEKSPSFTVSESKQFYHCFGCGAHGTALGFIMEYERLDFVDAVEALAAEYHLDVPREEGHFKSAQPDKHPLYQILQTCSELYQQQLKNTPRAVAYLKGRHLSGEIAKQFELGYAPDSWDFVLKQAGQTVEQQLDLFSAGMLIEKSPKNYYDRFRDRIMFPIRDRRGRVIGFGGRILDQGEPKYLNSPETPVFHKGQELYGLYEARQAVRELSRVIIVEGYMDVVALAQHGIPYAVATLGTATSQDQINQLFRIVPEIIFCFDGDQAGRKAGWRALENSLPVLRDGVQARFLFLPDGEDPDSLVRKEGQQAFEQRLQSATPLSDFLLNHLAEQLDLSSMDGRARLSELAKPLIAKLADGVFRDLLVNKLSETIGLSSAAIAQRLPETSLARKQRPAIQASRPQGKYKITNNPTRLAIAILLHYPEVANSVTLPDTLLRSNLPGLDLLYKLHASILQSATTSSSVLLERWRDMAEEKHLIKLMQWDIPGTETGPQRIQLFEDALANLQLQHIEQRLETLLAKSDQHTLSDAEKTELGDLYRTRIE